MTTGNSEATGGNNHPPDQQNESPAENTFSQADIDKAVQTALSQAGRDQKTLDDIRKDVDERLAEARRLAAENRRAAELQREREIEAAADDPEKVSALRLRHKAEDERRAAEEAKAEAEAKTKEANERMSAAEQAQKIVLAATIAVQYGVDAQELIRRSDGTREDMEYLAKKLNGNEPEAGADPQKPKLPRNVDNGGGGTTPTGRTTFGDLRNFSASGKTTLELMEESKRIIADATGKS